MHSDCGLLVCTVAEFHDCLLKHGSVRECGAAGVFSGDGPEKYAHMAAKKALIFRIRQRIYTPASLAKSANPDQTVPAHKHTTLTYHTVPARIGAAWISPFALFCGSALPLALAVPPTMPHLCGESFHNRSQPAIQEILSQRIHISACFRLTNCERYRLTYLHTGRSGARSARLPQRPLRITSKGLADDIILSWGQQVATAGPSTVLQWCLVGRATSTTQPFLHQIEHAAPLVTHQNLRCSAMPSVSALPAPVGLLLWSSFFLHACASSFLRFLRHCLRSQASCIPYCLSMFGRAYCDTV